MIFKTKNKIHLYQIFGTNYSMSMDDQ